MSAELLVDCGREVIGIGGIVARKAQAGVLITHALGSCLGVAVYDPSVRVGGLLHAQMPSATMNKERAASTPALYVDLGIPLLFKMVYELGATKRGLRVTVAGCANMTNSDNDLFNIATRNLTVMRKLFWQNGVLIAAEDTGDSRPRTMMLDLATGITHIESLGKRTTL